MYVLGLTGSIAMGKSWAVNCLRRLKLPVHESDACVHELLAPKGKAVTEILSVFPGTQNSLGGIDRSKLSDCVFGHPAELAVLEHVLHPMVKDSQHRFLAQHARSQTSLVVLDIPLLFEINATNRVDGIMVVSAPIELQYDRALQRPHMTLQKLQAIMALQMPDHLKCLGADFVIQTGLTRGHSDRQISTLVESLKNKPGQAWGPGWSQNSRHKGPSS